MNIIIASFFLATLSLPAFAEQNPMRNAYFGETHMHTAMSLDAYIGGARLMPSDALSFARGNEVTMPNGIKKQLPRPLDFAAVTDHAEYLGEMYTAIFPDAEGHDQPQIEALNTLDSVEERAQWFLKYVQIPNRTTPSHTDFYTGPASTRSGWQVLIDATEEHNEPGEFSAFIGFEWSAAPNGANLHRNVIFRDSNVPKSPISYIEVQQEELLWEWLNAQERMGMKVLAIPHNSNASKGRMFPDTDSNGAPLTTEYATLRQRFEPLVEMMQIKGNSEVHRKFWAADEFSDFENADSIQDSSDRAFSQRDFVRGGLKVGLKHKAEIGVNPFKYGFIGGTDNHNGLMSDVAEDDFIGGHGSEDNTVDRRRAASVSGWVSGRDQSIGSISGVWATENTRAAIWDAMKRRETFATSGPRIKLRMFGGVDLNATPSDAMTLINEGYAYGTPMGGTLPTNPVAPTFTVYAEKDPDGANLDRIQIVKGWVDKNGDVNEQIIDVVWAGDREVQSNGKLPSVGSTVDLTTATFTNDIGSATLMGSWTDESFDPSAGAFYYARALEIPTPRWTTYEAVRNDLPLLEDVPPVVQERAWGSPIWYGPTQ
ncbi:MAG: DUF3604 domain-containing protein [Paracoccaceae bacterium]|nr:DUF3604 domain-containing protein [Paracoccaceae bacterium]